MHGSVIIPHITIAPKNIDHMKATHIFSFISPKMSVRGYNSTQWHTTSHVTYKRTRNCTVQRQNPTPYETESANNHHPSKPTLRAGSILRNNIITFLMQIRNIITHRLYGIRGHARPPHFATWQLIIHRYFWLVCET